MHSGDQRDADEVQRLLFGSSEMWSLGRSAARYREDERFEDDNSSVSALLIFHLTHCLIVAVGRGLGAHS